MGNHAGEVGRATSRRPLTAQAQDSLLKAVRVVEELQGGGAGWRVVVLFFGCARSSLRHAIAASLVAAPEHGLSSCRGWA